MQLSVAGVSSLFHAQTSAKHFFMPKLSRLFHLLGADVMFELRAGNTPVCHMLEVIPSLH
jgi:hypothetical protein